MEIKDASLLAKRIIHALADDEEYPEEIYLAANFDLQERRREGRRSMLFFRAYQRRFRLTEILEVLHDLVRRGLVTYRERRGFSESCGPTGCLFRLTAEGERYWEARVRPGLDKCYDRDIEGS
jgi:hypothetical protein